MNKSSKNLEINITVAPVYDIVNCGARHRYMANGKLVHNSDKINLQNMPKRGSDLTLRRSLRAIPHHVWVAVDSSQIELRINAFLAGQDDLVEVFRSGKCPYVDMATAIYNKSYDEIYSISKGANPTKEGKAMRNMGKMVSLACGYGMSANTFSYRMKLDGQHEAAEQGERLVGAFRSKNSKITQFWKRCDQALEVMLAGGEMWFGGTNDDLLFASGKTVFHGVTIPTIRLPNGTYLFYQNLRKEVNDFGKLGFVYDQFKGRAFVPTRIFGSSLDENLCQALAFVILKWQALEMAKRGITLNLNVHDEWATVTPIDKAPQVVKDCYECMRLTPDYIPDGLLDCEVDVGVNYADLKTIDVANLLRGEN